jgi:two-component system CheB/CheR fusion protein
LQVAALADTAEGLQMRPACRVLLADDNVDAVSSLAVLLQFFQADVRVVYDGPSALRAAQEERPDLVILDIGMPGMDGCEVARRLRQSPGLEGVLLVALTGWGQEEHRRRTREAGFDYHLVKPADPEQLQRLLADPRLSVKSGGPLPA